MPDKVAHPVREQQLRRKYQLAKTEKERLQIRTTMRLLGITPPKEKPE